MPITFRKLILSLSGLILLGFSSFGLSSIGFAGEFYNWTDENGRIHYSSQKPVTNTQVKIINYKENHKTATKPPAQSPYSTPVSTTDKIKIHSALPGYKGPGSGTVVMYSTAWCGYCKKARRYFRENSIPFNEYDIEKSSRAKSEHKRYGGSGVPLLLFGQHKMRGFSTSNFEKLYYQ